MDFHIEVFHYSYYMSYKTDRLINKDTQTTSLTKSSSSSTSHKLQNPGDKKKSHRNPSFYTEEYSSLEQTGGWPDAGFSQPKASLLEHDTGGTRVVVSNNHLILQRVSKLWSGNFSCSANNVVGDALSNVVQIVVQCRAATGRAAAGRAAAGRAAAGRAAAGRAAAGRAAVGHADADPPVCAWGAARVVRVPLGRPLRLPCTVTSLPPTTSFSWTLSNALAQERVTSVTQPQVTAGAQGTQGSSTSSSVLEYRPVTQQDYGTLLCWAENDVGKQKEPCVYSVRPAPEVLSPPPRCHVTKYSHDMLAVKCVRPSASLNETGDGITDVASHDDDNETNLDENSHKVSLTQATRMKNAQGASAGSGTLPDQKQTEDWNADASTAFGDSNFGRSAQLSHQYPSRSPYEDNRHYITEDSRPSDFRTSPIELRTKQQDRKEASPGGREVMMAKEREENGIVLPFFVMTVREQHTNQLITNETSFDGSFQVRGLTPGVGYSLAVTSVGERGIKSPPTPLMATTSLKTQMMSDSKPRHRNGTKDLQILISGIIAGLIIIITILVVMILVIRRNRQTRDGCSRRRAHRMTLEGSVNTTELLEVRETDNIEEETTSSLGTSTTPTSIIDHSGSGGVGTILVGYYGSEVAGGDGTSNCGKILSYYGEKCFDDGKNVDEKHDATLGKDGILLGEDATRVLMSADRRTYRADTSDQLPPDILQQEFPPPKAFLGMVTHPHPRPPCGGQTVHFADDVTASIPSSTSIQASRQGLEAHILKTGSPVSLYTTKTQIDTGITRPQSHAFQDTNPKSRPCPKVMIPTPQFRPAGLDEGGGLHQQLQSLPLASQAENQVIMAGETILGLRNPTSECSCPISAATCMNTVNRSTSTRIRPKNAPPLSYQVQEGNPSRAQSEYQQCSATLPRNMSSTVSSSSRRNSLTKTSNMSTAIEHRLSRTGSISELLPRDSTLSLKSQATSMADLGKSHTIVTLDRFNSTFVNYLRPNS
ncbi:Immunoglobulin-like domain [Trinorchestia longiramus]|nr:Immunoglobulin-like domain [Trinorchestia longiramus]